MVFGGAWWCLVVHVVYRIFSWYILVFDGNCGTYVCMWCIVEFCGACGT